MADPTQQRPWAVNELTVALKHHVEPAFQGVMVEGEVSNVRPSTPGHLYFTLKDAHSSLPCVMWRSQVQRLGLTLRDGVQVVVSGDVQIYAPHGRYQMVVRQAREAGLGDLMAQLEELKRRLDAEGLFAADRKKPLPLLPRRVGVVTAPTGAAIRDILTTLADRFPSRVLIYAAKVQGVGAAAEIARGIGALDAHPEVDVIIAGRGGGSIEDLWAFNEEVVVRAMAACVTPVVSAVGHEPDILLSDLVADVRAATPTAAAELVVPHLPSLKQRVDQMVQDLARSLGRRLTGSRASVAILRGRLADPRRLVAERRQRVDGLRFRLRGRLQERLAYARERRTGLAGRLKNLHPSHRVQRGLTQVGALRARLGATMDHGLVRRRQALGEARSALRVLSPLGCLERGYAIARTPGGTIVRRAQTSGPGQELEILLHEGALDVTVHALRTRHGLETEGT